MIEEDLEDLKYRVRDLEQKILTLEDFAAGRKYKETKLAKELVIGETVLFSGDLVKVIEVNHEYFGDSFVKFDNGRTWNYIYNSEARVYYSE